MQQAPHCTSVIHPAMQAVQRFLVTQSAHVPRFPATFLLPWQISALPARQVVQRRISNSMRAVMLPARQAVQRMKALKSAAVVACRSHRPLKDHPPGSVDRMGRCEFALLMFLATQAVQRPAIFRFTPRTHAPGHAGHCFTVRCWQALSQRLSSAIQAVRRPRQARDRLGHCSRPHASRLKTIAYLDAIGHGAPDHSVRFRQTSRSKIDAHGMTPTSVVLG